jgi:Holliday junction DNA helicase RuvB
MNMQDNQGFDVNDARPSALGHLVGMEGIIEQIRVGIDSAFADGQKFPHTLLVSPPGCGKTELCSVIAQEMAVKLHYALGVSLKNIADLNGLLLAAKNDKDIIYIDEADDLKLQVPLYLALDQRKIILSGGSGRSPMSVPLADFTLLLSTNFDHSLLPALRDRMKMVLYLPFYSEEELTEILARRCRALKWHVEDAVLPMIAQRSKGTPRQALRLLSAARRVARSEGESRLTRHHLLRAFDLEGLDKLGLSRVEQKYLRILAEGDNRLNVIAGRLGLPPRTVSQVIESFLLRANLICKDDQSRRQLTALGREHLASLCSEGD